MRNAQDLVVELLLDEEGESAPTSTTARHPSTSLALVASVLALLASLLALSQVGAVPVIEILKSTNCEPGTYLAGWDQLGKQRCLQLPAQPQASETSLNDSALDPPTHLDIWGPAKGVAGSARTEAQDETPSPSPLPCGPGYWEPNDPSRCHSYYEGE